MDISINFCELLHVHVYYNIMFWDPYFFPIAPLDSSVSPVVKQSVAERWTTISLRNGLQSLPDALLQQITENGVPVHIGQPCTRLTFDNGKAKVCHPLISKARHLSGFGPFAGISFPWADNGIGCPLHM